MSMFYRSTRDDSVKVTASQAILKGLAADGGLFVPESIPSLDKSLEELSKMTYKEVAYEVMKLMLDDFTEEELRIFPGTFPRRNDCIQGYGTFYPSTSSYNFC